jgi:23S rRNA (adenine2503-C2)-methyltransferase
MLTEVKRREFKNGVVYLLKTEDGYPIEVTDTFLPFYTKDAIGRKQNCLKDTDLGTRDDRWMIGVSTMSGCPVRCKFCATARLKKWRALTAQEIIEQVHFAVEKCADHPADSQEFKINYTRMGEPFLNIDAVRGAIAYFDRFTKGYWGPGKQIHHYVSTIGIQGSDFSWIRDNTTLQISLHSLDEERRRWLIPFPRLMSLEELGQIRTGSKLKTTLNMTLVDEKDFDIEKLKRYFDPKYFFIKLSPINPNDVSDANALGRGVIAGVNKV